MPDKLPEEIGAQEEKTRPSSGQFSASGREILKAQVSRKIYALTISKRFYYTKSYTVHKRFGEEEQNKYVKSFNSFIRKLVKKGDAEK